MNEFILALPKLSLPNITVTSTFYKLIEEIGEAQVEFDKLHDFEKQNIVNALMLSDEELEKRRHEFKELLKYSLKELVDITQVCVSLLFVFEETNKVTKKDLKSVLEKHLIEISEKNNNTVFNMDDFYIIEKKNYKYMNLPFINREMSIRKTLSDILKVCGYYAQLVGKYSKMNGETKLQKDISEKEIVHESLKCIIQIAQNSLDLLKLMSKKYNIDLEQIFNEHINKLKLRGYLT